MKSKFLWLFLALGMSGLAPEMAAATDTGWMQPGVRLWYVGGVDSGGVTSSNAEETYLIDGIAGTSAHVVHHSALAQWASPRPVESGTWPLLDMSPCWIHPARLQTLASGQKWMDQVITLVVPVTAANLQFQFLPVKALLALNPQRAIIKVTYMIPYFSVGTAFFDADTGIMLYYDGVWGSSKMFFALAEINYDFARRVAFPEINGPHTGFMSTVSEQSLGVNWPGGTGGGSVIIKSQVESRYGATVEMRVNTTITAPAWPAGTGELTMADENYCFFGDVPVVRRMDAKQAPNYPPDQWNAFGQYLWWWLPRLTAQTQTINVFDVPMARAVDQSLTFTATQQPPRFFFSTLWFDKDGYLTEFTARDPHSGLDIKPTDYLYQKQNLVSGRDYYQANMAPPPPAPTVPDFNGDGVADLVWRNRLTGEVVFWLMNGTTVSSQVHVTGLDSNWRIVAIADFNKDGKNDFVVRNTLTGDNQIWYMNGTAIASTASVRAVADVNWKLVAAADFNADGKPDLVWRNPTSGQNIIWFMNGATFASYAVLSTVADASWQIAGADDFNADGKPELLWHNGTTGESILWYLSSGTLTGYARLDTVDPAWNIVGTGDFNGDGKADVLWRNTLTGETHLAYMNGLGVISVVTLATMTDPEWDILHPSGDAKRGPCDLDADGHADIVWRNVNTGENRVWYMNGANRIFTRALDVQVGGTWRIAGVADFDGDGNQDLVWRNTATGDNKMWMMNGAARASEVSMLPVSDSNWHIVAAGDFNADGKGDLVWRNVVTGQDVIWFMNGATRTSYTAIPSVPDPAWEIAGAADFNGDGKPDLVWRNTTTGEDVIWFMQDGNFVGYARFMNVADVSWRLVAVGDYNGDGKADVLWRNQATGQNIVWFMDGAAFGSYAFLPNEPDQNWKIGTGS